MKKNRLARENQGGFSLVELMVIVAVIAILAATAVPSIVNWLPDYRLKSASRDLFSHLQQAKIQAARLDAECVVFFDAANDSYQVVSGGPDGIFDGQPVPQNDDVVLQRALLAGYGSGVAFGPGNAPQNVDGAAFGADPWDYVLGDYILFDTKGMVFETGYVYLTNKEGTSFAVGTPTLAGSVVMRRWYNTGGWQ